MQDTISEHEEAVYTTSAPWNPARPGALVIACSDGRLQENLDEFLEKHLGITRYDRMYMPGGPGALASNGYEFLRSEQFRKECAFLVHAHNLQEILLIVHGAAPDGPPEATCADYRRLFPYDSPEEIYQRQVADMADVMGVARDWKRLIRGDVRVRVYRCEVTGDQRIRFVHIPIDQH